MNHHLVIFSIACFVRVIFAYFYFGSCDVDAFINITQHTLDNNLTGLPYWNYFPAVTLYLYIAGFLAAKTKLPIAFCIKIIPVIFDSMLAVLIYDVVEKSLRIGLLYALCPIPILVASIHGQYDCMFLFFLILSFYIRDMFAASFLTNFIFGALFCFSLLLKPVVLVLSPLFFSPRKGFLSELGNWWKWWLLAGTTVACYILLVFIVIKLQGASLCNLLVNYKLFFMTTSFVMGAMLLLLFVLTGHHLWRQCQSKTDLYHYLLGQLTSILGFLSVMSSGLFVFYLLGFNLIELVDTILRYCNQGVQIFGLPFAYPFTVFPLSLLIKNRIWLMLLLLALAAFYYLRTLNVFEALGLSIALILGLSGLCPQYLMWLVPFLLINRWISFSVIYCLVGSVFLTFFYSNPLANQDVPYQNGLSFSPLKNFSWLSPPEWAQADWIVNFLRFTGNYVIPSLCIGLIIYGVKKALKQKKIATDPGNKKLLYTNKYFVINSIVILISGILIFIYKTSLGSLFAQAKLRKFDYLMIMIGGRWSTFFIGHPLCNVVTVLLVITALWSVHALKCQCQKT